MNKPRGKDGKKTLLRNVTIENKKCIPAKVNPIINCNNGNKLRESEAKTNIPPKKDIDLDVPKLNTILSMAEHIKQIENVPPTKLKSIKDVKKKSQFVIDEKVSKKVNFPYDQNIYKDLIALTVPTVSRPAATISRPAPLTKDKEPRLSDFFQSKVYPEYSFDAPVQQTMRKSKVQFDGLRLYNLTQNWNKP